MGTCLYNKSYNMDMGYGSFKHLRETIADCLDKDFGEIYKSITPYLTPKEVEELDCKAEKIINEKNLDEDILNFLFASDSSGKLSGKHCKKLYEIIKNHKDKYRYGYIYANNSFEYFKEMVQDCAKRNRTLYWR